MTEKFKSGAGQSDVNGSISGTTLSQSTGGLDQEKRYQSNDGYWFDHSEPSWQLNKRLSVHVGQVSTLLEAGLREGFVSTLSEYARNKSADYTKELQNSMRYFLTETGVSNFTTTALINFKANLNRDTERHLKTIRTFLKKWYKLGHPGIDDDVLDLLKGWSIKSPIVGDAVKRLHPTEGPLSENELVAFNEGAARAFEQENISLSELTLALLTSNTGCRPIQIVYLNVGDLLSPTLDERGLPQFEINIPQAKKGQSFRGMLNKFRITEELWTIVNAQRLHCIDAVERVLGFALQETDRKLLPLFADLKSFVGEKLIKALRQQLQTDYHHPKTLIINYALKKVVEQAKCYSERTGELLELSAIRFRYTTGTRAAREGFGLAVIAELLGHASIKCARIYIQNIPDHAAQISALMSPQMVRFANAFQGKLVDSEADAQCSDIPSNRIRFKGNGCATCGQNGACRGGVPFCCYTCDKFQPWLHGPHEEVLKVLVDEREEVLRVIGDLTVAQANDRTILAVIQVIQRCEARKEELAKKESK